MNFGDASLCWRLLLIANSITVWVAWRRATTTHGRRPEGRRGLSWSWLAIVAWPPIIVATGLTCGWGWAAVNALVSGMVGMLVWRFASR